MRWFVTGTDTGVGKSVVTACLGAARRGAVVAAKPLASGVDEGVGEDAALIGWAAGHPPQVHTVYREPLSPHRAARIEGRPLDVPALTAWLAGLHADTVLVEGVGGWRVPLADGWAVPDLARASGGPVLVVAADRLGCLNHTLLTCEAVRTYGARLAGVVLNRGVAPDLSSRWNLEDLRELLDVPVAVLERVDPTDLHALASAGRGLWEDLST